MILLDTGLLNPTIAIACGGLLWSCGVGPRKLGPWGQRFLLLFIAVACFGQFALGIYRAYSVPRDVLQDIIAADEFSSGRRMHPDDMNVKIREALEREGPRPSLLEFIPSLAAREEEERQNTLKQHWVQAHPPALTLATVPFVRLFGLLGTQVAVTAIGILSLLLALRILQREVWPLAPALGFAIVCTLFGWTSVVSTLRLGQSGLLLLALAIGGWSAMRANRNILGGAILAMAVALKIVPAILILTVAAKNRTALFASVISLFVLGVAIAWIVPWSDLADYRATSDGVIEEYAAYPANVSLLGAIARWGRLAQMPFAGVKLAWALSGVALLAVLFWREYLPKGWRFARRSPLEFGAALGLSAIPILSPIAWDHYEIFHLFSIALIGRSVDFRAKRSRSVILFWLLLLGLVVPEQTFIWATEKVQGTGFVFLESALIDPFRLSLSFAILIWVLRLRSHSSISACEPTNP